MENKDKMVRNLLVVWLLTGLWHGANWTFVFWGLFNFVCLLLERLFLFEKMIVSLVYSCLLEAMFKFIPNLSHSFLIDIAP